MTVTEPEAVMPQAVITDEMIAMMAAKAGSVLRIDHSARPVSWPNDPGEPSPATGRTCALAIRWTC